MLLFFSLSATGFALKFRILASFGNDFLIFLFTNRFAHFNNLLDEPKVLNSLQKVLYATKAPKHKISLKF
jgi:hypothetical protein